MRTEKLETEKWRENQFKIIIQLLVETSETLPIFLSPIFLSKIFAKMTDFYLYYPARRAVVLLGAAIDAPIIFLSSAWHNPCNIIKNACGSLLSCTFR